MMVVALILLVVASGCIVVVVHCAHDSVSLLVHGVLIHVDISIK